MNRRAYYFLLLLCALAPWRETCSAAELTKPVDIGTRVEMFVDHWLIDPARNRNVSLKLNTPERREVVFTTEKPWDGKAAAYFTVFQDGPRVRMYYRGATGKTDASPKQFTCYAESDDGIHFHRPDLQLHEFRGSKSNNIILQGVDSHNFAPFLDGNPSAKPEERYKALAGIDSKLTAYASADGIHWKKMQDAPVMTDGTFDSLNLAFWDTQAKCYRAYSRYFDQGGYNGFRCIQNNQSDDFLHWTKPQPNQYTNDAPNEHFYTNATSQCPGAPHHYLCFPMRFFPERTKSDATGHPGVSDAMFLSSRDGRTWDRTFLEAWVRPGFDERNWTHRNIMPAWGIIETGPKEFSMYVSEHHLWPGSRLRRVTIPRHRFASVTAGARGGEFTTRTLMFAGNQLFVNYATSAGGSLRAEIQDANGQPLPGFALEDVDELFGDELDAVIRWKGRGDISQFAGKPVRFRFALRDADLFALRTTLSSNEKEKTND